jgi:hypothetical protein
MIPASPARFLAVDHPMGSLQRLVNFKLSLHELEVGLIRFGGADVRLL